MSLTKNKKNVKEETRKIYLKQHNRYLKDDVFFNRFLKMVVNPSYYHLTKNDFQGMKILDAGCGNSAYLEVGLMKLGASHITCLDLGKKWITPLKKILNKFDIPKDSITYKTGSTTKLPFNDNSFDMVFSNGVLMHLNDMQEIKVAFKELARVTKKGGYFYVVFGSPGGYMEEAFVPSLRSFYRSNKVFKKIVDDLKPDDFVEMFKNMSQGMKKYSGESLKFKPEQIAKLLDNDFCTWIQNITQVPVRHIMELDKKFAQDMFKKFGFSAPKRCRRFVKRENFRKYFAPWHFDSSSKFSKLLYGPGNLEFIAKKKI